MSLLETWVTTPAANAIGWTLLHSLWQGAIVAGILGALLQAARPPHARYALACGAMLLIFASCCVTFGLVAPAGSGSLSPGKAPAFPGWNMAAHRDERSPAAEELSALTPWLAPFWVTGVSVFYLAHAASWISVFRLRGRGVCCAPEHWQQRLRLLGTQARVARPVQLLESCLVNTPIVLGHLRPLILMPTGLLTGLPVEQIEAILLHELAHIRRYDYAVNAVQRLLEGMLFYHPAMWWISRVIRAEREHCCDDAAVAISGNAHEYALALATLERNRWRGRPAVAATGGSLVNRIQRLLYPKRASSPLLPLLSALLLVVMAATILKGWQTAPASPAFTASQKSGDRAGSSPDTKWLNEEVVSIIADEERAAFERLAADEERQQFIAQFWLRRDPTPGTLANEFRDEHYRRIAFANKRFRTASGRPGWQTDRGHLYIVYGPPDEIESHPRGAQGLYATQVWMYRHVEGIGENLTVTFVDRTGSGDYRLAPGSLR
jgi:GWxTD domain-containing protein